MRTRESKKDRQLMAHMAEGRKALLSALDWGGGCIAAIKVTQQDVP